MATTPTDQQRSTLVATALFAVALAIVAFRSIKGANAIESRPLPAADLQAVSSFLLPLPEASVLASTGAGTMVVIRDPFAPSAVAPVKGPIRTTVDAPLPTKVEGQHWVVSTILVEGSKKSAIVNNAWVTIGDPLGGGSHLTAVERDHIVVTDAKGIRHNVPIQGGESW